MLSTEGKHRLIAAGMFALPVFLVKSTGVLFTPAGVEATGTTAVVENVGIAPAPRARALTTEQQAALDRIEELRGLGFGSSPLYYDRSGDAEPVREDEHGRAAPTFTVGAIMAAGFGNLASIDGRFYREGETLGDSGWTIVQIDAVGRSVTIENDEGEQAVRFVERP